MGGRHVDGMAENPALGVNSSRGGSIALPVTIFGSHVPEAPQASEDAEEGRQVALRPRHLSRGHDGLLAAVIAGHVVFSSLDCAQLVMRLAIAGGAVLASVVEAAGSEAQRRVGHSSRSRARQASWWLSRLDIDVRVGHRGSASVTSHSTSELRLNSSPYEESLLGG